MFKLWHKNNIESYNKLNEELQHLLKKSSARILVFIGIEGSIKGLGLVEAVSDSVDSRIYSGIITEFYRNIKRVDSNFMGNKFIQTNITSPDSLLFLLPISNEIIFSGIVKSQKKFRIIEDWLDKNNETLNNFFPKD